MEQELKFDKKSHTYTVGKTKLTSVTTFVHSFFKPFDEKEISKYCARARRNKGEKVTATQIRKEWRLKREYGTKVHKQLEDFCKGKVKDILPETQQGIDYLNNIVEEWKAPTSDEFKVFSKRLKLAGTIDKVILHEDYLVSLLDWKTSGSIKLVGSNTKIKGKEIMDCNYIHYALQLSTYAYIMEQEYMCKIKDLIIVHLENDKYTEYKIPYMRDVVRLMLGEKGEKDVDRNK